TMVVASFSNTNLYSVIVSFFILIICHLQYLAVESWDRIAFLPARLLVRLLGLVFPNFQMFNIADQVALGETIPTTVYFSVGLIAVAYILVFNGLAIYSFRQREI